jgi:hypothetical protein
MCAYFHSPRIVTDGLVLALDTANTKSFRGEPTVNLVPSPTNLSTGWTNATSNATVNQQTLSDGTGIVTYTRNSESSGFAQRNCILGVTADGATPYTITVTYEVLAKTGNPNFEMAVRRFNTPFSRYVILSMSAELGRHTVTATAIPPDGEPLGIITNSTTANTSITVRFIEVQVEQKPYPTPFVNGTRGTTVATGGGWADRSGNGNHGELVNGPTFDSDNLGSLVFDGTDDRIIGTLPFIGNISNFSISIWANAILRTNTFDGLVQIEGMGTGNYEGGIIISFSNSNSVLRVRHWNDGGTNYNWNTNIIGEWKNIVLTISNNQLIVYDNSNIVINSSYTNDFDFNGNYRIGQYNFQTNYFNGNISQVQIYNRALTAQEIQQNYNATKGRYGL